MGLIVYSGLRTFLKSLYSIDALIFYFNNKGKKYLVNICSFYSNLPYAQILSLKPLD